jgi:AcrR family transcriptional regulator
MTTGRKRRRPDSDDAPRRSDRTGAPRRTNAERTAATRAKVLDAAGKCLADFGYGKTTTTIVAKLAGVSRGALLHHFPTRAELVVAAAEHLFEQRIDEVRDRAGALREGTDRADGVIELLFSMSRDPSVDASLEVIYAGRTDPELGPLVAGLAHRFERGVSDVFAEFFPRPDDPALGAYYDAVPTLFMAITDGLAVQRASGGPFAQHHDKVLELTQLLAHQLLSYQETGIPEEDSP